MPSPDRIVGPPVERAELEKATEFQEAPAIEAARYLLQSTLEMGKWAASVDWSARLKDEGWLKTPALIRAFKIVRRYDFLPLEVKGSCGYDRPLPIGHNQTNSQPAVVAEMLEMLQPKRGQKILDVGTGSAWSTALLAAIVGKTGQVVGVERIPELTKLGQDNLVKYPLPWARIEQATGTVGLPDEAPYDRILVSAGSPQSVILALVEQLKVGGIMVVPIQKDDNEDNPRGTKADMHVLKRTNEEYEVLSRKDGYGFVLLLPT